jgi:glycosyltransferase involved in cell wall biosynthesis
VREFVEAARHVRQRHPAARFQLLGFLDVVNRTAIARAEVEAWVAEGVVAYLGSTDDIRPMLAAADCVVLPSYREGTPRTLLEAAAMATPLIATDVPGCRDLVEDEVNGFLCAARDPASLAEAMEHFLALSAEQRRTMGAASRQLVETRYDEAIVISRYLDVVRAITGRG